MFEDWQLDKENFESYLNEERVELPLSDNLWQQIIDDVEGQVANYLDELLSRIALDIEEGTYDND
jgi:hypothetical protein